MVPLITQVNFSNVTHVAISIIQDRAEDSSVCLQDTETIVLACRRPQIIRVVHLVLTEKQSGEICLEYRVLLRRVPKYL